jgi:hypothetical protein
VRVTQERVSQVEETKSRLDATGRIVSLMRKNQVAKKHFSPSSGAVQIQAETEEEHDAPSNAHWTLKHTILSRQKQGLSRKD